MFSKGMIWLDQSSRPVALRPMSRELTITARAQGQVSQRPWRGSRSFFPV